MTPCSPAAFAIPFAAILALVACSTTQPSAPVDASPPSTTRSTSSPPTSAPPTSAPPDASSARVPDANGPPQPVALPTLEKLCAAAPCSGAMSEVIVWRSKEGKVKAFEHRGDLQRCSHAPTVFYDADAKEIGAIPDKPVAPGSDEAKRLQAIRADATRDLVKGESLSCKASK